MSLKDIIQGHSNKKLADLNLLKVEKQIKANERLDICKSCDTLGDNYKCLKSKGGCGCDMEAKVYCMDCKCPKGKW